MEDTGKNVLVRAHPTRALQPRHEISPSILWEPSPFYFILKRVLDVVLALLGLTLLSPVLVLIALCVFCVDRGPVLHFREIVGYRGKRFYALKFRTMIPDADTYLERHPELLNAFLQNMKLNHDPRVTAIGHFLRKTSLDELPQLVNVFLGQMSLVGPRMIHPSELPRYDIYAHKRLAVKPGITGLWQVSGRQNTSYEERIVLDMRYIDSRSTLNDVLILLKTVKVFFVHTGA